MAWQISFDGQVYREDDLTIGQAEQIEELCGLSWLQISPYVSAKAARAILSVLVSEHEGITVDQAAEKVRKIKVSDFGDMIGPAEDDLPTEFEDGFPQKADEPSTDG